MAKQYKVGFVIEGDADGGTKTLRKFKGEVSELDQATDKTTKGTRAWRKETDRQRKSMERSRKVISTATKALAGFSVALGASFVAMTASGLRTVDSLAKVSARLGLATEDLAKLRFSAEQTGVSTDTLDMALQRMTRRVAEAAQGTGEAVNAINELGLSAEELVQLSPDEVFRRVTGAMEGVENQSDKVRLAMKLFDSEGVSLVQTMAAGTAGLDEFGRQAEQAGIAINRVDAAKVEEANDAINRAKTLFSGFAQQLAVDFAPVIEGIAEKLFQVSTESEEAAEQTRLLKEAMRDAGVVLDDDYVPSLDDAIDAVNRLISGEALLNEVRANSGKAITNNTQLMARLNVQFGEQSRANERHSQLVGGMTRLLEGLNEGIATQVDTTRIATQATRELGNETSSLPGFLDKAERSYDGLMGSLSHVNLAYMDHIKLLHQTEFRMKGVGEAYDEASESGDRLTATVEETTEAMRSQERMLENIQRNWADMFYDMEFTAEGAFDSILDGFRRMMAEMLAADAVNIVFNGGGMDSITNGNTANGLKNIMGMFGAGGGAQVTGSTISGGAGPISEAMSAGGFSQAGSEGLSFGATNASNIGASFAAGAAGNWGGGKIGESIFGKEAESGIGGTIGGIAGSYFGPIGSAVGAAIGGAIDVAAGGDGYKRSLAGFDTADTEGFKGRTDTFDMEAFASGFDPTGVAHGGATRENAIAATDPYRAADQKLFDLIQSLDATIDTSSATFSGNSQDGQFATGGTFLGSGGRTEELDVIQSLNRFVVELAGHAEGLDTALMDSIKEAGSAGEVFKLLSDAVEDTGESAEVTQQALTERYALETRLLKLQGDTTELRSRELDRIDESNRVLQEHIWFIEDASAAIDTMAKISKSRLAEIAEERQGVKDGVTDARTDVDMALSDMQRTMSERAEEIRAGSEAAINSVRSEREYVTAAYASSADDIQSSMDRVSDAISSLRSRSSMLDQAVGQFSSNDIQSRQASRGRAFDTLSGAGLSTPMDQLESAISALSGDTSGLFSSLADQQYEQARSGNLVADLRDQAAEQLTTEERTLQALENRAARQDEYEAAALSRYDAQIQQLERNRDERLTGLQEQLDIATAQVNSINGVSDNVVTLSGVTSAIASYEQEAELAQRQLDALDQQEIAIETAAARQIGKLEDLLAASNRGFDAMSAVHRSNNTIATAIESLEASITSISGQSFSGGGIATGPQSGYTATLHGTELVIPMQNGSVPVRMQGGSGGVSSAELKTLREEMQQMNRELAQIRNSTSDMARYEQGWEYKGIKIREGAA